MYVIILYTESALAECLVISVLIPVEIMCVIIRHVQLDLAGVISGYVPCLVGYIYVIILHTQLDLAGVILVNDVSPVEINMCHYTSSSV